MNDDFNIALYCVLLYTQMNKGQCYFSTENINSKIYTNIMY